jgi:hypothetical protein
MDVRVYEILLQSNQGLDQTLESFSIVEKLELGTSEGVGKILTNLSELRSFANIHFASKTAQKEQGEESNFYSVRRNREKPEEGPNEICRELKSREELRRNQGLPPRAVILRWTQADDNRVLSMQKTARSLPIQPEQPRITGDSEQENQTGGTPP